MGYFPGPCTELGYLAASQTALVTPVRAARLCLGDLRGKQQARGCLPWQLVTSGTPALFSRCVWGWLLAGLLLPVCPGLPEGNGDNCRTGKPSSSYIRGVRTLTTLCSVCPCATAKNERRRFAGKWQFCL